MGQDLLSLGGGSTNETHRSGHRNDKHEQRSKFSEPLCTHAVLVALRLEGRQKVLHLVHNGEQRLALAAPLALDAALLCLFLLLLATIATVPFSYFSLGLGWHVLSSTNSWLLFLSLNLHWPLVAAAGRGAGLCGGSAAGRKRSHPRRETGYAAFAPSPSPNVMRTQASVRWSTTGGGRV